MGAVGLASGGGWFPLDASIYGNRPCGRGGVRLCLRTRLASTGLFAAWTASGCIDDISNIACFAVLARRQTARSRADDGVLRQSLAYHLRGRP